MWQCYICIQKYLIAWEYDRRLDSTAVEEPVKFASETIQIMASKLAKILG